MTVLSPFFMLSQALVFECQFLLSSCSYLFYASSMGNIFCITTIFSFFLYPVFKKCDFFSEITKSVLGVDLFGFFEQTGTLLLGTGAVPAETQLIWRKQPNREAAARAHVPLRQSSAHGCPGPNPNCSFAVLCSRWLLWCQHLWCQPQSVASCTQTCLGNTIFLLKESHLMHLTKLLNI